MNVRKSWFSYILWTVSLLLGLLIFIPLSDRIITIGYNSIYIAWMIKAAFILLPFIFAFTGYKIFKNRYFNFEFNTKAKVILHTVCILVLIAFFFGFRYFGMIEESQIMHGELFEQFKIGSNPYLSKYIGIINEGFYNYLASFVLLIFGNKIEILVYLQLILQLITTIAIYIAATNFFKVVFGMIPAVLLCFNPYYIGNIFSLDSSNYDLMIFALVLMIISFVMKNADFFVAKLIITSVFTGVLMFYHLDLLGLILMLILFICETEDFSIQNKLVNSFLCLILSLFSFIITYVIHYMGNVDIIISLFQKFQLKSIDFGSQNALIYQFVITLLMFSYLLSFWFSKNIKGHNFVLAVLIQSTGFIFIKQFSSLSESFIFLNIMMSFIITESMMLIFNCIEVLPFKTAIKSDSNKKETKNLNIKENHNSEKLVSNKEIQTDSWAEMQKNIEEERKVRKKSNEVIIDKKAPIENVLPLPKKHVKRSIDYNYELNEKDMHFDLELNEHNSDYDV